MRDTIRYSATLTPISCGDCAIPFAVPEDRLRTLQQTGESFWCPNGHRISYHQTENAKLRAQLDQAKADAAWQAKRRTEERQRAEHERARANGYKGALAKTKKRVAAGVCPCCQRSFVQLARHMKSQHPDYGTGDVSGHA